MTKGAMLSNKLVPKHRGHRPSQQQLSNASDRLKLSPVTNRTNTARHLRENSNHRDAYQSSRAPDEDPLDRPTPAISLQDKVKKAGFAERASLPSNGPGSMRHALSPAMQDHQMYSSSGVNGAEESKIGSLGHSPQPDPKHAKQLQARQKQHLSYQSVSNIATRFSPRRRPPSQMHLGQFMDDSANKEKAIMKHAVSMPIDEQPQVLEKKHNTRSNPNVLSQQHLRSSEASESVGGLSGMLSKLAFGIFGPSQTEPGSQEQLVVRGERGLSVGIDDELCIECNHCKEMISSREIDEHELHCTEIKQGRSAFETGATNVSGAGQVITVESASNLYRSEANNLPEDKKNRIYSSDKEDVISPERTPIRNKVVHEQFSHLNTDYKKHQKAHPSFLQRGLKTTASGYLAHQPQNQLQKKYSTRNLAVGSKGGRQLLQKNQQHRNASTAVLRGYRLNDSNQTSQSKLLDPMSYHKKSSQVLVGAQKHFGENSSPVKDFNLSKVKGSQHQSPQAMRQHNPREKNQSLIGSVFSGLFEGNFLGGSSSKAPTESIVDTPKVQNVGDELGEPQHSRNNQDNDSVTRIQKAELPKPAINNTNSLQSSPSGDKHHNAFFSGSMLTSPFKSSATKEPSELSPRFRNNSNMLPSFGGLQAASQPQQPDTSHQSRQEENVAAMPQASLLGLTPIEALEQYEGELTSYEMTELTTYDLIYTIGSFRVQSMRGVVGRDGFYSAHIGEQLGYRYLVEKIIDAGAFGQVMRCIDMKEGGRSVAVKISKNKKQDIDNASCEAKLLTRINSKDPDKYGIVKMLDSFHFRRHYIIVFELLDINLYRYIKQPGFRGMNKDLLRQIAIQLLYGLQHLSKIKIIHCDLKPENILFTDATNQAVKIIDLGSACTDFKSGFVYVQSRYYRCPEVVLGLPYDQAVDMWSFGCILAELVTGRPLFPALDEHELLELFIVRIGMPPEAMINQCNKRKYFFDQQRRLIRSRRSRVPKGTREGSDPIRSALYSEGDEDFIDFVEKCLIIDPKERLNPEQALKHNWIKRNKLQSMFKENYSKHGSQMLALQDLEDVIRPLPSNKRERLRANRQAELMERRSKKASPTNSHGATNDDLGNAQIDGNVSFRPATEDENEEEGDSATAAK